MSAQHTKPRTGSGVIFVLLLGMLTILSIAISTKHYIAYAADGDLDLTFSSDGKQTTNFISRHDEARAVAIQSDGKIVVVGTTFINDPDNWDFFVTRYLPNGDLDVTFDGDGMAITDYSGQDDGAYGVAIQPDGKIVVVGAIPEVSNPSHYYFGIVRYNTDGSLDNTFSDDGIRSIAIDTTAQISVANAVAIQSDGKIVLAGYTKQSSGNNFALARLNPDGSLDNTFDGNGLLVTDFNGGIDEARSIAIQSNGKIVVAGNTQVSGFNYDFAVARYEINGALDNGLNSDGKATVSFGSGDDGAYGVALQSDGKLLVAGAANTGNPSNYSFAVARLTSTGNLDSTFNGTGLFMNDMSGSNTSDGALAVAIQSDDKIVAAGFAPSSGTGPDDFALIRLSTGGLLDASFSGNGRATTDFAGGSDRALGVAIQPDGKIVAAGYADMGAANSFDFAVARYDSGQGSPTPEPTPSVCTVEFTDVPPGSTFYDFVHCLACQGIVSGLPDGTFGVNNSITRGQLSKIVSNAASYSEVSVTNTFEDVPVGSTFFQFVERLNIHGVINGFLCGGPGEPCVPPNNLPYFRPNANVTRGQTSKIVAIAKGLPAPSPSQQTFEDVPTTSTFWQWIESLATAGSINGFLCGGPGEPCNPPTNRPYFRPSNQVTRGQSVKIISLTFFPGCSDPPRR